jgi:hypothetical protein
MRITGAAGIIISTLCLLMSACQSRKNESLSAPEKRIHLDAKSLARPYLPPPASVPTSSAPANSIENPIEEKFKLECKLFQQSTVTSLVVCEVDPDFRVIINDIEIEVKDGKAQSLLKPSGPNDVDVYTVRAIDKHGNEKIHQTVFFYWTR